MSRPLPTKIGYNAAGEEVPELWVPGQPSRKEMTPKRVLLQNLVGVGVFVLWLAAGLGILVMAVSAVVGTVWFLAHISPNTLAGKATITILGSVALIGLGILGGRLLSDLERFGPTRRSQLALYAFLPFLPAGAFELYSTLWTASSGLVAGGIALLSTLSTMVFIRGGRRLFDDWMAYLCLLIIEILGYGFFSH